MVTARFENQDVPGENWFERIWKSEVVHGVSVEGVVVIIFVVCCAWILSRLTQRALNNAFQRRTAADQSGQFVIKRLVHYLIMLAGVFLGLNIAGFSLSSLFAAGAVFAVVIGFALQNLSENFVSGVILMVERSITPDDVLEVEGRVVKVVKMGIRATVARTRDDEDVIIPNSMLVTSAVKNFTLRDTIYRMRTTVGVAYSSDMVAVRHALEAAATHFPSAIQSKPPRVLLTDFGSSSVNFEVSVWIEDPWRSRTLVSDLNEQVWKYLKDAGIVIAFPQLDVHFDPELLESLRARREAAR